MTFSLRHTLLTTLWLVCGAAAASGLQVSPVTLTLAPTQNADGLWLSNTGDNVVHAQCGSTAGRRRALRTSSPPRAAW